MGVVFQLFGSTTSPFVRRVRVVAASLDVPFTLINDADALKALTPIGKIPVGRFSERVVFDSHTLIDYLFAQHGYGPFRPLDREPWTELNFANAIDGALDSGIQSFYLKRDGAVAAPYLEKQSARIAAVFAWLEAEMPLDRPMSVVELALITAIEWMRFRQVYSFAPHPRLTAFAARVGAEERFVVTSPAL